MPLHDQEINTAVALVSEQTQAGKIIEQDRVLDLTLTSKNSQQVSQATACEQSGPERSRKKWYYCFSWKRYQRSAAQW